MHRKIFRSSFLTALLVLVITVSLILGVLYAFFEKQLEKELQSEARYIAHAVEREGLAYFEGFESKKRITVVDFEGRVLYDSESAAENLDNHREREEIRQALEKGVGRSERYSDTVAEKTVYYAVRLENYILRISTKQYTVITILFSIAQPIFIVLLLAVVLCFLFSSKVAKNILKPINSINPDNPESACIYEELSPLIRKLSQQKETIRKQLEDAIRKREEFSLITENMSEGFLVIDKATNLLTHNTAALRLLGIERVGTGSVLSVCRVKAFREVVEDVLMGKSAERTMAFEERSYRLIGNPVFEGEETVGAVIIIIDVTEIENREKLRREFTANVSHELKTPLTSISGFAELMKNGGTPEEIVIDFAASIYNEANRLIHLVNDIIKISELDDKDITFEEEAVDLYALSADILARLVPLAEKKKVSLHLMGDSAFVNGSRKILEEMIFNLCDNAIKYNKENGTVDVIINYTENKISILVRDTGIGIPALEQERVFERFYRVDKSHSKKIGGTGLGLSIVKHGAMHHGAKVYLESSEGEGTCVTVDFPKFS